MRLKVLTTALFVFGILLLIGWPWILGGRPVGPKASQQAEAAYALRLGLYFIVTLLTFFFAALCAFFLARREREAIREQAKQNVQELIEGTLRDHEIKKSE
jgi:hypothetical protein